MAGELDRVVVMEKRPGTGAAYPENLRNGDWEFAAFTADGKSTLRPLPRSLHGVPQAP